MGKLTRASVVLTLGIWLTGCATHPKRYPLPEEQKEFAQIPYIPDARFWGDELPPHILQRLEEEKIEIQF
mgnify:CR=1 FL=1